MANEPTDPTKAQAWISGTPPDQTIDFYIPRGNAGPRGPEGPVGPSLSVGDVVTNMGPAAPGTVGAQGLPGVKGDPGGITLGTLLNSTHDLNNYTTSGVYRWNGTAPLNGPGPTYAIMYVDNTDNGSRVIQRVYRTDAPGKVIYERGYTSSWQPWRTYSSNKVDQTAGRAIYHWDDVNSRDQLIYGDTGLRVVSPTGTFTDMTNLIIWLRRVGTRVTLTITEETAAGTAPSGMKDIYTLPSGFKVVGPTNASVILLSSMVSDQSAVPIPSSSLLATSATTANVRLLVTSGKRHYSSISWDTNDAWPAALPGTAYSSIPNI